MKHNYRLIKKLKPGIVVVTLVSVILFFFPISSLSRSIRSNKGVFFEGGQTYDLKMQNRREDVLSLLDKHWGYIPWSGKHPYPLLSKNYKNRYDRLSPEEKAKLKKRYREWESLPEHKRQMLRRRMEKYEQLPPQERERFKQRHRQLRKMSPDERYMIREKLRKWDRLSPDEKEQIRQRFRRP